MASSTSFEGDLDNVTVTKRTTSQTTTTTTAASSHKHLSRSRQRIRSKHPLVSGTSIMNSTSSASAPLDPKPLMGSNGMAFPSLEVDQKLMPAGRNSCNKNIRHRRNLREKRRPTGVVHILSTESADGTSSETDDEGLDDDLNVKKNTAMNEQILFLPLPTAHLRALAAQHASRAADQEDDEDEDDEHEEDVSHDKEEDAEHDCISSSDPQDMRQENQRLRDQLKFKDAKIKQLEARIFQLEIQHKNNHSYHNNSPKKRNQ